MLHAESRKSSSCDAVVFRERPLDIVCLTIWNGTHTTLEKQEANLCEVSSQHLVGFFKDECTNLLWRRAAGWLDWMGRDEPERQRAESQWIVAARPLCHLQYPVAYLSHLQRILLVVLWKLYFKAATATLPPRRLSQRNVPLGAEAPTGKTNLSHDGLNPAHIPYWWVNNPTLGEFCFTMIGRADIEGSKSNVAMNAWLPQASYPCGNFSDTSSFKFRRSKGSLGHAFTMCCPSQTPHLTVPWCHGAVAPRHYGTGASWHHDTNAPRHCHGAMAPWHQGTVAPMHRGTIAPWHHGTKAAWRHGTKAPWRRGTVAPRHHGTKALTHRGKIKRA
ncbi:hypothetical protein CQW23_33481 [Capsicum baccatum]|uniref:Senescence-associated protein n=1 Tax=Capsicum baccatum TaxID=33114 RepID=A0A2G2V1P7_CAPBA|nr:hypothetical protein CQW23_33481 [Capsicum baccatum]